MGPYSFKYLCAPIAIMRELYYLLEELQYIHENSILAGSFFSYCNHQPYRRYFYHRLHAESIAIENKYFGLLYPPRELCSLTLAKRK